MAATTEHNTMRTPLQSWTWTHPEYKAAAPLLRTHFFPHPLHSVKLQLQPFCATNQSKKPSLCASLNSNSYLHHWSQDTCAAPPPVGVTRWPRFRALLLLDDSKWTAREGKNNKNIKNYSTCLQESLFIGTAMQEKSLDASRSVAIIKILRAAKHLHCSLLQIL